MTARRKDVRNELLRNAVTGAQWFAVVDAAQEESAPQRAGQAGLRTESLYAGEMGAGLDHVAPHLVSFDLRNVFSDWFLSRWGDNLGIVLQSKASFEEVRKHLRRFLLVKNEAGKKYRFRFYDPRVLRSFLPTCSNSEVVEFFGPVLRYFAEGQGGEQLLEFGAGPRGLTTKEYPVEKLPRSPSDDGAGAKRPRPETGALTVVLYDAGNGTPLVGASLQVTGPVTKQARSDDSGVARFARLDVGEYEIYAIDRKYRSGTARINVGRSGTEIRVACQPPAGDSGETNA